MGSLWRLITGDCPHSSPWLLSVPYLVGEPKITTSFLEPPHEDDVTLVGHWQVVPWLEGCGPGPKCHCRDVDGQAGWELVGHKTQSCNAPQKWEMHYLTSRAPYQGLLTSIQQVPGLLQASVSVFSLRCWPASQQTRWMCAPFQIGRAPLRGFAILEYRFPLPYLVLGKKKGFVLSILASARNRKISKTPSKKLISFKKRAIEIVILPSYCLMNLLSPVFSAQKWGLTCLKQGGFLPFICCSISSYQSRSWKS